MKEEKWPWIQDPKAWADLLWRSIGLVSFNIGLVQPMALFVLTWSKGYKALNSFQDSELPLVWTLTWQLLFCFYIEDIGFGSTHRLFHQPFFYKHIHKVHHTYTQAVGISGTYTHPVEFIIGNMLPVGLPAILLGQRMHMVTFMLWTGLRIFSTTNNHCGYDFPWIPYELLPFKGTPSYHDFHHSGGAFSGNYSGQTNVLDSIWGTNTTYLRQYLNKERAKYDSKKEKFT
jgi:sterol desaturase/sphingolipid hydroxylase (fatty acid hydroxylase superfamily)